MKLRWVHNPEREEEWWTVYVNGKLPWLDAKNVAKWIWTLWRKVNPEWENE